MFSQRVSGFLALLLPACVQFLLCTQSPPAVADQSESTAQVSVVNAEPHALRRSLKALGSVAGDPDRLINETLPYDVVIDRVLVRVGQSLQKGTPLLHVKPAPAARLASVQAQTTLEVARASLARSERLLHDRLGTQADVDSARKNLADAEAAYAPYADLRQQGIVRAPADGALTQLNASAGQQIGAGTALLQITPRRQQLVLLGIEPEDRDQVKPGQPVELASVFEPRATFTSAVQEVHAALNPGTRLLDVVVPIPAQAAARWLPGMHLRGLIILATETVLAIPRGAVLEDEQGSYVYRVEHGKARKVHVGIRYEAQGWMAVESGLRHGDAVVVSGNYELGDGMAVTVTSAVPASAPRGDTP